MQIMFDYSMKKILALSGFFLGIFLFESHPSKSADNLTPYQTVIQASAINFCSAEYGIISDKESYQYVMDWMKDDHGFEPYQVSNLMKRKSWATDTDDYIAQVGGCKKIADLIKAELARKPYGLKSLTNRKKDYEYFYKIDLN